jgi:hypothetical protein
VRAARGFGPALWGQVTVSVHSSSQWTFSQYPFCSQWTFCSKF